MKKLKKITTLLLAAALFLAPMLGNTITAQAEEPTTYYVKYQEDDKEWRFQYGSWEEGGYDRELYYLEKDIVDGDIIVVEGSADTLSLEVDVRLSNLTVFYGNAMITAKKGIDNCYVAQDSFCLVNGNITNAYVYDNAFCNFNDNVTNLEIIGTGDDIHAKVAVVGTVAHLKGYDTTRVHYEFYNFAKDTLYIENGAVHTDEKYYSKTPTAATTPATPAPSGNTGANDYDDVPKTGEWNPAWMLLGVAAVCAVMSRKLRHI